MPQEPKNKTCPTCKNTLDISAFGWYGKECNGCGEFGRNEMQSGTILKYKTEENWEEKFDITFSLAGDEIRDFIRNQLLKTRNETIQEVIGILEGMKPNLGGLDNHDGGHYEMGFDQALSDIKTQLEEMKNE
ncbi:MAG: hypothetical protein AABY22_00495 [Nanoarchaeota archaeon]